MNRFVPVAKVSVGMTRLRVDLVQGPCSREWTVDEVNGGRTTPGEAVVLSRGADERRYRP